jgi:thiamine-phosphate pyrophosphorylase
MTRTSAFDEKVTHPAPPRVIVIPDDRFAPGATIESLAAAAISGGADCIQLRAKGLAGPDLVALGRRLAAACRARGALFFMNDDAAAALACGADGVHVGPGDMVAESCCDAGDARVGPRDSPAAQARRLLGERGLVGVSIYTDAHLEQAEEARADYVAVGAVYPTATKAIAVVGLDVVRRWRAKTRLPIIAIGGIDATNAAAAITAGADGVAVISAVCGAADPEAATRELCERVRGALAARGRG